MPCTTHHHACDCREAEFARIKLERDRLREALREVLSHCRNTGRGNVMVDDRIVERCEETARAALGEGDA